jgi:hypothetical protein
VPLAAATPQGDSEQEVESYLRRRFEGRISQIEVVAKEDLGLVRPPCGWQTARRSRHLLRRAQRRFFRGADARDATCRRKTTCPGCGATT